MAFSPACAKRLYENTHIERLNETIKNQYLNRWMITTEKQLIQRVETTINTYNNLRPHQSLAKMTPIDFESNLLSIPLNEREKLKIFTTKKGTEMPDPKQLKLFNT